MGHMRLGESWVSIVVLWFCHKELSAKGIKYTGQRCLVDFDIFSGGVLEASQFISAWICLVFVVS